MTTIYLISNSSINKNYINDKNNDNIEYKIFKTSLNYEGINNAIKLSKLHELSNIDYIYSSKYYFCIETSNFLSKILSKEVIQNKSFNLRKIGITKLSELPSYYKEQHYKDINYKLPKGESQKEVKDRMYNGLLHILNKHRNKKIIIITHPINITYLLKIWCTIPYKKEFTYNNKIIFNGIYNEPTIFKLEFNKDKLENIKYIKV